MSQAVQQILLEMPEPAAAPPSPTRSANSAAPKLKPIDRSQGLLRPVIVEELVGPDHKVRAIWDLTGQLDLSGFYTNIKSKEGKAGNAAWDPRLLLSIWVYAYSEQVTSARKVDTLMDYEPGLMWLAGMGQVNYWTLNDFRTAHQETLTKLMAELLGTLSKEGLIKLEIVAHDGTKVRAQAGSDTFRREKTLEKEIAKAEQMVAELEQQAKAGGDGDARREAAQRRAARERSERMKEAAEELKKIRAGKDSAKEREEARVSLTEPEARIMKHGDGGFAPSYNVQLSTDSEKKVIVGVQVTQSSSDSDLLEPAMEQVREQVGRYPEAAVADGGFTNQASIEMMKEKGIAFYGSLVEPGVRQAASMKAAGIDPAFRPSVFQILPESKSLRCPAGKVLGYVGQSTKGDTRYRQYRAKAEDCGGCEYRKQCCPRAEKGRMVSIRMEENAEVAAFREKMKTEEAQKIYKRRGAVAEFPNLWIKEKLGIRKFRLRGLVKATTEAIWGVLTYNVMQWRRLSWKPKQIAMATASGAAV
jgi:transposase